MNLRSTEYEYRAVADRALEVHHGGVQQAGEIAPGGTRYAPVEWSGAAPGGHHREGVLRFQPIRPAPSTVELQIQRPKESAPRVFRWNLD